MIRAGSPGGDGHPPMLFLGLSAENIRRLVDGQYLIHLSAEQVAELGLPAVGVVIAYGQTEDALFTEMAGAGIQFARVHDRRHPDG